jgi:hypothetical protein
VFVHEFSDMDSGAAAYDDSLIRVFALTNPAFDYEPPQTETSADLVDSTASPLPLQKGAFDITGSGLQLSGKAASIQLSPAPKPTPFGKDVKLSADAGSLQGRGAKRDPTVVQSAGVSSDFDARARASHGNVSLRKTHLDQLYTKKHESDSESCSTSDVRSEAELVQSEDTSSLGMVDMMDGSSSKSSSPESNSVTTSSENAHPIPDVCSQRRRQGMIATIILWCVDCLITCLGKQLTRCIPCEQDERFIL